MNLRIYTPEELLVLEERWGIAFDALNLPQGYASCTACTSRVSVSFASP
jgi:hypothetical protein